jgi:hypothetical protein
VANWRSLVSTDIEADTPQTPEDRCIPTEGAPSTQTARDKGGVPGLLSFTSWAATPAAQDLRGGSTQRAGRSVHRYAR